VIAARDHVLIGKERHDIGRPHDWGYPIRGIVKGDLLFLQNFKVDRWPGGNPETGYLNCDGSPTKTEILKARKIPSQRKYWMSSFGKRPVYELYNIRKDPECMTNLADDPASRLLLAELRQQLLFELAQQQDPRTVADGDIFDRYEYADQSTRGFYERYMSGESIKAGWVSPTDFDKPLNDQGDEIEGQ
jgi:hypothetical protein